MIRPVLKQGTSEGGSQPDIITAAYAGDVERVATLLKSGVDVNTRDPRDSLTVLHIGCLQGDRALVDLVLEWDRAHDDVDFELKSSHRPRMAWQFAINSNHLEIARRVDLAGINKRSRPRREP